MRTSRELAALVAVVVGCAEPPPPPAVSDPIPACAAYTSTIEVYATCVERVVARTVDGAEARAVCETLPATAAASCRKAWVDTRMRTPQPPPRDELLAMCAEMPDCRFAIIEFYRESDVLAQAEQCRAHAGQFASDCVGHALQQWQMHAPSLEDHARVIAGLPDYPGHVGNFVGLALFCAGKRLPDGASAQDALAVGCPGSPEGTRACMNSLLLGNRRPVECAPTAPPVPPPPHDGGAGAPPNAGVVMPQHALDPLPPPP